MIEAAAIVAFDPKVAALPEPFGSAVPSAARPGELGLEALSDRALANFSVETV
jgi:hypothetical protein